MQNDVKRTNMYLIEKFCEVYTFGQVLRALDYSVSFDIQIENDEKNTYFFKSLQ